MLRTVVSREGTLLPLNVIISSAIFDCLLMFLTQRVLVNIVAFRLEGRSFKPFHYRSDVPTGGLDCLRSSSQKPFSAVDLMKE